MRRSNEPEERAQFTVAELLARYGDPTPATGRRHRRAAERPDTAAQPQPASSTHPASSTQPHLNGHPSPRWAPAVGGIPPVVPGRAALSSPVLARRTGMALSDGPVTEQLPRLDPAPMDPQPWSSPRPASTQPASAPSQSAQPSPAGPATAVQAIPEQIEQVTAAGGAQTQAPGSPLWEWALMVSQIGIGVAGGAAVWLICEWFWQRIPVVALIVALAVITGLVWVVRRIRGAEDLQTTVIAVLVGLFVTVSPAVLLLVGR